MYVVSRLVSTTEYNINYHKSLACVGLIKNDIVQIAFTINKVKQCQGRKIVIILKIHSNKK